MTSTLGRRLFLQGSAATIGGLALAGPMSGLARAGATGGEQIGGYGPLAIKPDNATGLPLLAVPPGFEYWSFGWAGERMTDRFLTPNRHDGMAAFPLGRRGGPLLLVRNHERGYDPVGTGEDLIGDRRWAYDETAGGGCTTVVWDPRRKKAIKSYISINGTSVNCAGGPVGNSWLTCEETTEGTATFTDSRGRTQGGFAKDHGYVFDVPADWSYKGVVRRPEPIRDMGRFRHEAVSYDEHTGHYFETEDNGETSGFYRFVPRSRRHPDLGGTLQMLKVKGRSNVDLGASFPAFTEFAVEWVDIPAPDPATGMTFPLPDGTTFTVDGQTMEDAVYMQGWAKGAASFDRLEGIWYGDGKHYFNSTSGGEAGLGQVWEYDDRTKTLRLIFESHADTVLDSPDNIVVTPRGGLVLCEDGDEDQYLRGLTLQGQIFPLARNEVDLRALDLTRFIPRADWPEEAYYENDFRTNEFAGATWSPDGDWLFFNIQTPGISFAMRGPWGSLL